MSNEYLVHGQLGNPAKASGVPMAPSATLITGVDKKIRAVPAAVLAETHAACRRTIVRRALSHQITKFRFRLFPFFARFDKPKQYR